MAQDPIIEAAMRFAADDPDPQTAATLRALIAAADIAQLRALMEPPLAFGTAGLRGLLGAGPARMNRATVARTTAGLCEELLETVPDAVSRGLCVGYDARHGSRALAEETAQVALGHGLTVHLFADPGPTPLLAFATLHLRAAAGVMVTASHNPPAYNGYKVYLDHGAQLNAPVDAAIAARMREIPSVLALRRLPLDAPQAPIHVLDATLAEHYLQALSRLPRLDATARAPVKVAYSPLHGVGYTLLAAALAQAGAPDLHAVPAQVQPDPDFPTVAFPNPEEPGAMDAVLALGEQLGADLALANDPDADRLAVAARDPQGQLRTLTGNQVGALLADALLAAYRDQPSNHTSNQARPPAICYSLVSTPLATRIAHYYGARADMTLTGFKWISNRGIELAERGYHFVLGFEEALGYAVNPAVRDKDGIAAAQLIVQLTSQEKAEGGGLWQRLLRIYRRHGCHVSGQLAITLSDGGQEQVSRIMDQLRTAPPPMLAGLALEGEHDLLDDADQQALGLPPADVVLLAFAGGQRICVRPSGTEPKLKFYFDVCIDMADGEDLQAALARGKALIAHLRTDLCNYLPAMRT